MTTSEQQTGGQLAAALAAFQRDLPRLGKDNRATVRSDKGTYTYTYADLAEVSKLVLPLLAKQGLSFSAKPTLTDEGKFVLEYTLRHSSGESDTGRYPLPSSGTPQQVGSAISYARRYALSAVTGIAPDEDDDGVAAEQHARERRQQQSADRQQPQSGPAQAARNGNGRQRPPVHPSGPAELHRPEPPVEPVGQPDPVVLARADLGRLAKDLGIAPQTIATRYKAIYDVEIGQETDPSRIAEFAAGLQPAGVGS